MSQHPAEVYYLQPYIKDLFEAVMKMYENCLANANMQHK